MKPGKMLTFLVLLFFLGILFGCQGSETATTASLPQTVSLEGLKLSTYPSVDGSTSTLPLQRLIACHIFQIECEWTEGFLFDETRNILPVADATEIVGGEIEYLYTLSNSGTHDAYMNLINGYVELILVAREPSADEVSAAESQGVTLDFRPVALDAFVFLVNEENPIDSINLSMIRDIYTGRVTKWDQVGVELSLNGDNTIHSYRRNPNSGSEELMKALVMKGEEMIDSPDMLLYGMVGPFNAIKNDMLGIGYSVYYYATYMLPTETVRLVAVDGILPITETIADRSYPFVTEVYVVIRTDTAPEGTALQLRNWLLTAEGQSLVAQSGYVPIFDQ